MKKIIATLFVCVFAITLVHAGDSVEYTVHDLPYEGYYTAPAPGAPLVLILHDWDGLTDYEMKRAEMLAEEGYAVFAADLFGKGIRPTENKDKRQHTGELYQDRTKMRALMEAAVLTAGNKGADTDTLVVMGYCFGGAAALEYARSDMNAKGYVTFHGGLSTPEGQGYENTKGTVLVFHGSADTHITMKDFATLTEELESANVSHEMITYGGAPHSFTVYESEAYQEAADQKSWKRFLEFLTEVTQP